MGKTGPTLHILHATQLMHKSFIDNSSVDVVFMSIFYFSLILSTESITNFYPQPSYTISVPNGLVNHAYANSNLCVVNFDYDEFISFIC